jgi:hypothetical protein
MGAALRAAIPRERRQTASSLGWPLPSGLPELQSLHHVQFALTNLRPAGDSDFGVVYELLEKTGWFTVGEFPPRITKICKISLTRCWIL